MKHIKKEDTLQIPSLLLTLRANHSRKSKMLKSTRATGRINDTIQTSSQNVFNDNSYLKESLQAFGLLNYVL